LRNSLNKIQIELIAYDFDGVLTDNKVYLSEDGIESVQVNRSDGLAIKEIEKMGLRQIIISTEKNKVVKKRAEKLNIECFYGIDDKKTSLSNFCNENSIDLKKVIFIGNDINDLEVMKSVGISICPSDAHPSIIKIASVMLNSKGGEGLVRELLDLLSI